MQLPTSAVEMRSGQPLRLVSAASSEIGRVRADHVRLELREVDLDDLVVELLRVGRRLGIRRDEVLVRLGEIGERATLGGAQVDVHAPVEREHRAGGAQLGAHVADRALAGARDVLGARAEVLDDFVGAALYRHDPAELEDDVLR